MNATKEDLAIRNLLTEQYPAAVKSRIAENYTALYADDVTYIPFDGPECNNKEEMTGFFNGMKSQFSIDPILKLDKINIYASGKDAYAIGKSFAKLIPTNGEDVMNMTFRAMWILVKEEENWKIQRQLWNVEPQK